VRQRIFVVEDDPDIAGLLRHHLEMGGFSVQVFAAGHSLIASATKEPPALFGRDGFELCRDIRRSAALAGIPIIFVTAKGSEADRVLGLELGADDYVTKPFSPREVVARVKAVLRRFERPLARTRIEVGDLVIDPGAMTVEVRGGAVSTTATEFRLLDYFARHPGRVFSRDQLLDAVWRDTSFVTPRSIDVYVRRLREKIERDPEDPVYLRTVRGAGYRFEAPK
jgi:DNA-binding response OmpR family regulator